MTTWKRIGLSYRIEDILKAASEEIDAEVDKYLKKKKLNPKKGR